MCASICVLPCKRVFLEAVAARQVSTSHTRSGGNLRQFYNRSEVAVTLDEVLSSSS